MTLSMRPNISSDTWQDQVCGTMLGSRNIGLSLRVRLGNAALDAFHYGRRKGDRHAVMRMYALHRTYTLNISPSICGFNECAGACRYTRLLSPDLRARSPRSTFLPLAAKTHDRVGAPCN